MVESIRGTRIRERRRDRGITQADLARRIEISPSYLNLIEGNKRRIGRPLLERIAGALGVEVSELDGAEERQLAGILSEVAHLPALSSIGIETERAPEFIARFPGWARAIAALARSERSAQQAARTLSDRLTHDPFLGETVHRMLTRIAAIRSTGEILTEFPDVPAEQAGRFHRIIQDEATALTDIGEALATYFNTVYETERSLTPQDEVEALFAAHANHFAEIEEAVEALGAPLPEGGGPDAARALVEERLSGMIDTLVAAQAQIETTAARNRANRALIKYATDAVLMPLPSFRAAAADAGYDIEHLAESFAAGTDAVCRRLAALPGDPGLPEFGYILANASGAIIEMMALNRLILPRFAAACPLWVLYRGQQAPETSLRQYAVFPSGERFIFVARARNTARGGYRAPRHYVTDMLTMTDESAAMTVYAPDAGTPLEEVGPACGLCPRTRCPHRADDPLTG